MAKPTFDLDALDRPDAPDAFTVKHGGRSYTLTDPHGMQAADLVAAQNAILTNNYLGAIALILQEEDRDEFFASDLPVWKVEAMLQAYNKHFGLDPGKSRASRRSSQRSGRR